MTASFVIPTRNRRSALLRTLDRLRDGAHLPDGSWETWVVDNGSTDGTAEALQRLHPHVRLIRHEKNHGPCARQDAVAAARGKYLVFLDDDCEPRGRAVAGCIDRMERNPRTAAVTGRVDLPDGTMEASAYPQVPICCALCVRRDVLQAVGGFSRGFVRQAEELDLAMRILDAGYETERFEDLRFLHRKTPGPRSTREILRLDMRNNLLCLARYVPAPLRERLREDWIQRYTALAAACGLHEAAADGLREADRISQQPDADHRRAGPAAVEAVFRLQDQAQRIGAWARRQGIRRVCIADLGKNIYATYEACRAAGLEVTAVGDGQFAFHGLKYRGLPIDDEQTAWAEAQGVVLSSINPARVQSRLAWIRQRFDGPVLGLWEPRCLAGEPQLARPPQTRCEPASREPSPPDREVA